MNCMTGNLGKKAPIQKKSAKRVWMRIAAACMQRVLPCTATKGETNDAPERIVNQLEEERAGCERNYDARVGWNGTIPRITHDEKFLTCFFCENRQKRGNRGMRTTERR
jgi:hypothetical protein